MHPAGHPVSQAPWSKENIVQEQSLMQILLQIMKYLFLGGCECYKS